MKAYHIRTVEPDPHCLIGMDTFDLDSIFVPEERVLVGFAHYKKRKNDGGVILDYSDSSHRAQAIIEGNRDGVRGDIISELDLNPEKIGKIAGTGRYHERQVRVSQEFDGSTDSLLTILIGPIQDIRDVSISEPDYSDYDLTQLSLRQILKRTSVYKFFRGLFKHNI